MVTIGGQRSSSALYCGEFNLQSLHLYLVRKIKSKLVYQTQPTYLE